jgi:hypothetical protein
MMVSPCQHHVHSNCVHATSRVLPYQGTVVFYLLRLEPFTSYATALQGGRLDHADRLFHSVPETWNNCLTNPSDLKELTPEFYYLPEFLRCVLVGSAFPFVHCSDAMICAQYAGS